MSDFIRTNATEAGGELTEDEFFRAMRSASRVPPRPAQFVTSRGVIEKGQREAVRLHGLARDSLMEFHRLRRWRFVRRFRALRRSAEAAQQARAMESTFGKRDSV